MNLKNGEDMCSNAKLINLALNVEHTSSRIAENFGVALFSSFLASEIEDTEAT